MAIFSSMHWFRKWLGAIRQQAITRAHVDPGLCHHMASLGHNELNVHYRQVIITMLFFHGAVMTWAHLPQFGPWNLDSPTKGQ